MVELSLTFNLNAPNKEDPVKAAAGGAGAMYNIAESLGEGKQVQVPEKLIPEVKQFIQKWTSHPLLWEKKIGGTPIIPSEELHVHVPSQSEDSPAVRARSQTNLIVIEPSS